MLIDGVSIGTTTGVLTLAPTANVISGNKIMSGNAVFHAKTVGEVMIVKDRVLTLAKHEGVRLSTKWRY